MTAWLATDSRPISLPKSASTTTVFSTWRLKLIDVAVDAGADAVKFQKRNLEKLYAKKYLENANAGEKTLRYLLPILQQVELSDEDYYTHRRTLPQEGHHLSVLCVRCRKRRFPGRRWASRLTKSLPPT